MAATTATVVPEFLQALRLKKRDDPIPPTLQSDIEGDEQAQLMYEATKSV